MKRKRLPAILRGQTGMTLLEVLIAALLSGIVMAAAFEFYVVQHRSWLMQTDVSDVQQSARACLEEIELNLRMAGLNLSVHPAYELRTDTLAIYMRPDADVDTILYYISRADTLNPRLIRKTPGESPKVFADGVEAITLTKLNKSLIRVELTTRSERTDTEFLPDDGYRRRQVTSDVRIRNLSM